MQLSKLIKSDPDIMGGVPVFVGTRVPVKALWDYIEGGDSLSVFLEQFPTVSRKKAVGVLEQAKRLVTHARTA